MVSSFGLELKPNILNVFYTIKGDVFKLNLKDEFEDETSSFDIFNSIIFEYFYTKLPLKKLFIFVIYQLKRIL